MTNAYTATDGAISTSVSGSSYQVTVVPGETDPTNCFTSLNLTLPDQKAGEPFYFTITLLDEWGNHHTQETRDREDDTVLVTATYQNHGDWLSEIGLDYLDFVATYGTTVTGILTDINDGTITASLTILWAADYTLVVTVNGIELIDSPWLSGLKVLPAGLDATSCIVAAIPE